MFTDSRDRSVKLAIFSRVPFCRTVSWLWIFVIWGAWVLNARVLRIEITSRSAVFNGKPFDGAGAYERIIGRVYFSVAVTNPHNRRIVDLENAVNLKNGEVEFSSDFVALRPK